MCSSHQIEPRTAILSFTPVLNHLTEIDIKHIFLVKKQISQQNEPL